MAGQELVTPTPFMKSLSAADYEALKKDVESRVLKGKKGFEELERVIQNSGNTTLRNAYNNNRSPLKFRMSWFINIKTGFSNIEELKVNETLKQNIINIYNTYFKDLEEAGQKNIKYDVKENGNKSIIIYSDSDALIGYTYERINQILQKSDIYGAKAVVDYMMRYLLGQSSVNSTDAQQFLLLAINNWDQETSPGVDIEYTIGYDLLYVTPAGHLGALEAILEKLNNYNPGSEVFISNPESSATEDASVTLLEARFNEFISTYGISFNLSQYFSSKVGQSILDNNIKSNSLKRSFYTAITPSEQLKDITNNKYVVNIWNKIKESRTIRASSICRLH
jgi:hypothetical protein